MQIKTKKFSCHKADSKPVKQEVNGTVILPPLVFPGLSHRDHSLPTARANMHCQGIACTRPFDVSLASAEGQKLVRFKEQ